MRSTIILTIICFINFAQTRTEEDTTTAVKEEDHNVFLNHINILKDIVIQLETDVDKLQNGLHQQADIIYNYEHKDSNVETKIIPEIIFNRTEEIEEFYKYFDTKLLNLNNITENSLKTNNDLLWNKTQKVEHIIASLNKCVKATKEHNSPDESESKINHISQQLEKQMLRIDTLKEKIQNLNNREIDLQKKSENLSNMMNEILTKLQSQDQYFINLEKQLPVMQGASKTLDDYIVRKTEFWNERHQRCRDGNCHHWHRRHHHQH